MDKHLSIIVCAYNEEKTIHSKIKDALAKDKNGQVHEIIIVDDNSSDRTFEIAQDCSKDNERIVVIKNAHKEGKWGALATGYKHARGGIICLTDADVTFEEDTLQKALRLFGDPSVGGVTSNQKVILIRHGKENAPSVSLYEKFRNFFRKIESKIDSTMAFHGQCMFFRKDCLELIPNDSRADDLDIAMRIRKKGYRTLFSDDSYYIEKMADLSEEISKRIFKRRAEAVAQTLIRHRDLLFNRRYKKFAFICFPIEFFINIVLPFFVMGGSAAIAVGTLLLPNKYKFLFIIFISFVFLNRKLLTMAWYQMISVIGCLFDSKYKRWMPSR